MSISEHVFIKNGELILALDYVLNEEEKARIKEANIKVKYKDKEGRLFIKDQSNSFIPIHPLLNQKNKEDTIQDEKKLNFQKFKQYQEIKSYTALNAEENIFKGDIQIKFRSELDDCLAHILFLYTRTKKEKVKIWLNSMRSILGNVMAATCMDFILEPFEIDGLLADEIHKYSHTPLKYLKHDHIVPSFEHGIECIQINTLRTKIRMCEVSAYSIYARQNTITRPDILYTLNRLSSACYVLMIMLVQEEQSSINKED